MTVFEEATEQRKLAAIMFTDMVGSTQLKQRYGDREAIALIQQHHEIVHHLLRQFGQAEEIETAGDSFLLVFGRPSDATRFAFMLQNQIRGLASKTGKLALERIGIHVGEVFIQQREEGAKLFAMQVVELGRSSQCQWPVTDLSNEVSDSYA